MNILCPHCQQPIDALRELAGQPVDCPTCGGRFEVPGPAALPALPMADAARRHLVDSLAYWLAAGTLEAAEVFPGIQTLTGDQPASVAALLETLAGETDDSLVGLARYLRQMLREETHRLHEARRLKRPAIESLRFTGLPLSGVEEWQLGADPRPAVSTAGRLLRDLGFLAARQEQAPRLFREVQQQTANALANASAVLTGLIARLPAAWFEQLASAWADDLPGREAAMARLEQQRSECRQRWLEQLGRALPDRSHRDELGGDWLPESLAARFSAAESRGEQRRLLDLACAWLTPATVPAIVAMVREPWSRDRASLNLSARFGRPELLTWEDWLAWLGSQERLWQSELETFGGLVENHAPELLLSVYSQVPDPDPAVLGALVRLVAAAGQPVALSGLLATWSTWVPGHERNALLGLAAPESVAASRDPGQPPPLPQSVVAPVAARTAPAPVAPMVAKAAPVAPPKPSLWEVHIQPFFVENWYIVAGIAMVILGSSLLAYYTWDKHWLVRYTIMPLLLGGFTWSLAKVGDWIERQSSEFTGTAAMLRGAAIGLLPINFMAMALLSADENVPRQGPALLAMALIYLIVFGWGLRRWCGAVEPAVGKLLGGTLLGLNALVVVGPLARTVGHFEGESLLWCVGAGFYVGFAAMAATIVYFARRILTREMAEEKRVPWFVAGVLAVTFLQVFIWAHGFLRHLPQPATYALLVILTGWLILHAERRALELKACPQLHGGESFLGFGAILLGLLMGFGNPTVRILAFLLAGAVWLYQARARRHPLHDWIGLTLLGLGGAAVGLLPSYPGPWLPLVGVAVALAFGVGGWLIRRLGADKPADPTSESAADFGLVQACRGMQLVALVLTALITPLVQSHYDSWPFGSAIWLGLVAGLFAWRAFRDEQVHLLHVTMAMLALALPYAGFMDVAGRTVHHNTMVGGLAILSWLWLGLAWWTPKPLILQARSTVSWLYGVLAVAAMLLRVAMGDTGASEYWLQEGLDFGGPIMMMLALIPATYYSRSLGPAGMAVAITVILFPELKSHLPESMGWVTSGSGLASAGCTLLLVGLCFALRPWAFLKDLSDGDRFMGKELFPFQRRDHTLFTWPILAAAVFLLVKVDSWNLLRNVANGPLSFQTALALATSGVAWTIIAIYHRQHREAVVGVHLGWICMAAGIGCGYWRQVSDPHWTGPVLVMGLLLQGLYGLYRGGARTRPWVTALLAEPTRHVLLGGSAAVTVICLTDLLGGAAVAGMPCLYGFLTAQLVWHGLRTRQWAWGVLLFMQCWIGLLELRAPGTGLLLPRLSVATSLSPTLWLLVVVQLLMVMLEVMQARRSVRGSIVSLVLPGWMLATGLAILLGLAGVADGVHGQVLGGWQQLLLLVTLLLTARSQASSVILWPALLLGYLMIHRSPLTALGDLDRQLELLATPWRVALFGLGIALLTQAGRWVQVRHPRLLAGVFAIPAYTTAATDWLWLPAAGLAAAAALYHTAHPVLRESGAQLWAPYLGVVTFALVAWGRRQAGFWLGAGALLVLGNIHLVRVGVGEFLRDHGVSELHLICLGLGLSLLQASGLRRALRGAAAIADINRASLGVAGLVLTLLSANYFTAADLAAMTPTRLLIAGTLALLAGWYFRRAARQPGPGEAAHAELCEALYHFGVVVAWWCAALLVPCLRQPQLALVALSLPVAYFYFRAEIGMRQGQLAAARYRNSAAVLGFIVLALYVFEGFFHLVLFPGTPVSTRQYHSNAPLMLLLGVVLLRLHGLGGTSWLAFYGGLALMAGSYFLLTALPGLSPFDSPMAAAWCALVLGHFWILLSYERSPLRTIIQRLARLDDPAWDALRRVWGYCLLAATQGAVLWGLVDFHGNSLMVAPLLAGAASVFIHQGILRRSPSYLMVAGVQLMVALHLDFFIASYVPKEAIIWVGLGGWLGLLAAFEALPGKLHPKLVGRIAAGLGGVVLAHILYHRPWSPVGLWGMGLGAILLAWTPSDRVGTPGGKILGELQSWIPIWLVYFSQAPFKAHGLAAGLEPWPVLAATTTLLLIALTGRYGPAYWSAAYHARPRTQLRGFDLTLGWLEAAGRQNHRVALLLATGVVCAVQGSHYQLALGLREFSLLVLLEAALAVAWFFEGRDRQSMAAYFLMQLCAAAFFASIRRHLMLTTVWWKFEYDVWASLAVSFGIAGVKQVLDLQPRALRVPLLTTLCAMPVLALGWVMGHGLGVDLALIVVGLHSVLFAYLGKDNRESPYNILALAGFVGFVLLTFYAKLQLRAVHAYIIPVGLGVLVLQELFRKRIHPETRNWIRLVTLMAMLGSTGYYALADPSHAISFNLTMILLCLLAMGLGSVLRIRLYLALGFAGLMVDLVSLLYKVLVLMERSARMTVVGSFVLLIGGVLIFTAIYYKTNQARIDTWLDQWRTKLAQWQ
ncbi:MAG: hypothetical protein NTW21_17710 [Verrucomicrobia bacterium]|nr:hypothetical protein [Verrucomicrobiota bacterium]